MKLSEVSLSIVKQHCGISGEDSDALLGVYMAAAKRLACDYTGLDETKIDEFEDITVAYLDMINEMFSQRAVMTSGTQMNEFVRQILDIHSVNYL